MHQDYGKYNQCRVQLRDYESKQQQSEWKLELAPVLVPLDLLLSAKLAIITTEKCTANLFDTECVIRYVLYFY